MVFGLPMYGRTSTFNVPNPKKVVFGETTTVTTGFAGPFSKENGFMGYNEVIFFIYLTLIENGKLNDNKRDGE